MKHKIIGSGSTKPRSETTTANNFKTGPKILKERVMSVVTRMRNTNFTIIRENHNHDTTTSPDNNNLDKSVPDVNLHSSITSSATCGNLDSLKSSSNSKNIKKKLKRRDKKNKSLDKLFDNSHDNVGSSPVRSIFNRRKDSNAESRQKSSETQSSQMKSSKSLYIQKSPKDQKEQDQYSLRTCSSVANLDKLYDELDLMDDYDYEMNESSQKSARSSHRHSFSGAMSPFIKPTTTGTSPRSSLDNKINIGIEHENESTPEKEKEAQSNYDDDDDNDDACKQNDNTKIQTQVQTQLNTNHPETNKNEQNISDDDSLSDCSENPLTNKQIIQFPVKSSTPFSKSKVPKNSVKNSVKKSVKQNSAKVKNSVKKNSTKITSKMKTSTQKIRNNHQKDKNENTTATTNITLKNENSVEEEKHSEHNFNPENDNFKKSNSSKNNPIIITSPPPPPEKSSHQTTVSSSFTAGNCPSDIVETKSISSLISRNSFKPGGVGGAEKNNNNNQLENNNAGHSSVLFTPFFERNDSNSETR